MAKTEGIVGAFRETVVGAEPETLVIDTPPAAAIPAEVHNNGFVPEVDFEPPAGSTTGAAPSEAKRGRPADTPEEKAAKEKAREIRSEMGDLFGQEREAAAERVPEGGTHGDDAPTGEATSIPRKRAYTSRKEFEALAEIVCLNQYGLMGMLFDPIEANPLATDAQGQTIHPQGMERHLRLKMAYAEYFKSKDVSEVSPGLILLMVNLGEFAQVTSQPKSSEKMKGYMDKAMGWVRGLFKKKQK